MKIANKTGPAGLSLVALTALLVGTYGIDAHRALAADVSPPMPNFPPMSAPPSNAAVPAPAPIMPAPASPAVTAPSTMPQPSGAVMAPAGSLPTPTPTPMTATGNAPAMPPVMPVPAATSSANPGDDTDTDAASAKDKDTTAEDKAKSDKKLAVLENKVSDSVRDVVKHLGSSTENVTLDDLNSARQAVAKLEALIDIEKHMADLDKIRSERENAGNSGGSAALGAKIPMSALQPLPMQMANFPPIQQTPVAVAPPAPTLMPVSSIEVTRITGSDGHFVAIMKTPDGSSKPVHVGDHLTDGSSITGITSKGVVLDQNGTTHVIPVKNVNEVFSNTR